MSARTQTILNEWICLDMVESWWCIIYMLYEFVLCSTCSAYKDVIHQFISHNSSFSQNILFITFFLFFFFYFRPLRLVSPVLWMSAHVGSHLIFPHYDLVFINGHALHQPGLISIHKPWNHRKTWKMPNFEMRKEKNTNQHEIA